MRRMSPLVIHQQRSTRRCLDNRRFMILLLKYGYQDKIMKEERLEHLIAMVLSRWMGGENLRQATEDIADSKKLL